ncbi:MAG: pyrroline-5-carboxylate reductase dimerization domain-containing protein [Pseudomonadota bacterium]
MKQSLGFLGVGHLAGYLIAGLRRAGFVGDLWLSPRSAERAARLAQQHDCRVAVSNQALVSAVETVILTVRPSQVDEALTGLSFSQRQLVISACAGVCLDRLEPLCAPARVSRAMPISAAAVGASPSLLYPYNDRAADLLGLWGSVIALESEASFETASVNAAAYAWFFALFDSLVQVNEAAGLETGTARRLVLETASAAAQMAEAQSDQSVAQILESLATKGGISAQGLAIIEAEKGLTAWQDAFRAVHQRLQKDPSRA